MAGGIPRVNGSAVEPSQRASTISFYTLTFGGGQNIKTAGNATTTAKATNADGSTTGYATVSNSDVGVVNGALDQIFRVALGTVCNVGMIGTVSTDGTNIRFAIEDTGVDVNSAGYLGTGPTDASPATVALALQGAVRTLGTNVNGITLAAATVASFTL
jgi:hypothetical protein